MSKVAFKQADMERLFKAAAKASSAVQMDMKTLIATILPVPPEKLVDAEGNSLGILPSGAFAQDGKENWDED